MSDEEQDYAEKLLLATREELLRADNKASILLASGGLVVGALIAALLAGDWSPFTLSNGVEWMWWAGVLSACAGIVWLGRAVYPQSVAKRAQPDLEFIAYYGDVGESDAADISRRISHTVASPGSGTADQIKQISSIVVRKYSLIKTSFMLFSISVLLITVSLILNLVFS